MLHRLAARAGGAIKWERELRRARTGVDGALSRDRGRLMGLWSRWSGKAGDAGLQQRTGAVYAGLAAASWHGPWSVVGPDVDPAQLARVW